MIFPSRLRRIFAGISGCSGVAVSALAAHEALSEQVRHSLENAAYLQLLHSAALLALREQEGLAAWLASVFFALGILLFCGGLQLAYLAQHDWLRPLLPAGGMSFMAGWLCVACLKKQR